MSIKDKYTVKSIKTEECKEWFLKKHYAKRIPNSIFTFGIYTGSLFQGVVSYGMTANNNLNEIVEGVKAIELNRLVINDDVDKNALSFFVSQCLNMLPKPKVIISYSDLRQGHHGYIYQATNWVYTGIGGEGQKIYIMKDGTERHQRHEDKINHELVDRIELTTGKARYYYFVADKRTKRKLNEKLRFETLPYPKGQNKRYDASYKPSIQTTLF